MTDSTKRLLFGSVTTNKNIKLCVTATIQYTDKPDTLKQSHSLPKSNVKKEPTSPKGKGIKPKANDSNDLGAKTPLQNLKKQMVAVGIPGFPKGKPLSKSTNISKVNPGTGSKTKKNSKTLNAIYKKINSSVNNKIGSSSKKEKEPEIESDVDPKDTSVIDEAILKEISQFDDKFNNFQIKELDEANINELKKITEVDTLLNKTKTIIDELLRYQTVFYEKFKDSLSMKNRIRELLIKYNEKYRSILKKQHRLQEQEESNDIRTKIVVNINRDESKQIQQMLPVKKFELQLYKSMYNLEYSEKDIKKYYLERERKVKEDHDTYENLCLKILKGVIAKHGPLTEILTTKNASQSELYHLSNILTKYKLPNNIDNSKINEEKDEENKKESLENVVTSSPDETDTKLNNYLNVYYSKKKLPKIPFIKTSANNYEYGTQKVMAKVEGDTIRLRFSGGYILLDKFLELNAALEEIKLKSGGKAKNEINVGKKKMSKKK